LPYPKQPARIGSIDLAHSLGSRLGSQKPASRFNEQTGKTQYSNFASPPMNDPRMLRIQVADEYRVITRAKLGNHPNRNFANLTAIMEKGWSWF
jgi:hypothetical protein